VLLATEPGRPDAERLRVDPTHPVHFDHPQDHVPGMAIIDAARQAALLRCPGWSTAGIDVSFLRFVDLDAECLLESTVGPGLHRRTVTTTFVQRSEVTAVARTTLVAP
jgi:hypothetical protein